MHRACENIPLGASHPPGGKAIPVSKGLKGYSM